jgi:superfamily I DNA and/or RNA helicase
VRELISRVYTKDSITLEGRDGVETSEEIKGTAWQAPWQAAEGVYLILHEEQSSQRSNELEAEIIRRLLDGGGELPAASVAVVTPHRAQRALLGERLAAFTQPGGPLDMIDTVERLQGGERPTVIVSACASDPNAISSRADFLLNLNRANVAFSRPKERLIVVVSRALLEHIPEQLDVYESSLLWKSLRGVCRRKIAEEEISGHRVRLFSS